MDKKTIFQRTGVLPYYDKSRKAFIAGWISQSGFEKVVFYRDTPIEAVIEKINFHRQAITKATEGR